MLAELLAKVDVLVARLDLDIDGAANTVYRSETEMLRYLRKLSDRDLALDRAMIPLGSCTMKLNATSEMIPAATSGWPPLTWPMAMR